MKNDEGEESIKKNHMSHSEKIKSHETDESRVHNLSGSISFKSNISNIGLDRSKINVYKSIFEV